MEAAAPVTLTFNPVCRELGAPPRVISLVAEYNTFQSRLPGVGGSADAAGDLWEAPVGGPFNPVCRELGAPPRPG